MPAPASCTSLHCTGAPTSPVPLLRCLSRGLTPPPPPLPAAAAGGDEGPSSASEDDELDPETALGLLDLGIASPVTRETAGSQYHRELARQVSSTLGGSGPQYWKLARPTLLRSSTIFACPPTPHPTH